MVINKIGSQLRTLVLVSILLLASDLHGQPIEQVACICIVFRSVRTEEGQGEVLPKPGSSYCCNEFHAAEQAPKTILFQRNYSSSHVQ